MQLKLDTATWDLELDSSGNIATLEDTPSSELQDLICQRIRTRLQTFEGECFLDRDLGVPYFSEVMKKNPDVRRVRSLLLSEVSSVEGVSSVKEFSVQFFPHDRRFNVIFNVIAVDGTIVEGSI